MPTFGGVTGRVYCKAWRVAAPGSRPWSSCAASASTGALYHCRCGRQDRAFWAPGRTQQRLGTRPTGMNLRNPRSLPQARPGSSHLQIPEPPDGIRCVIGLDFGESYIAADLN